MSVKISESGYFHSFESEALPNISWQEMFDRRIVFDRQTVLSSLAEAEQLLVTHPGPNLERRKILAPEWFGYWKHLLQNGSHLGPAPSFVSSDEKFIKFENLADQLSQRYPNQLTGMLFVAGAEGHPGHVSAASYMKSVVSVTNWGFEQPQYMQRKVRKAPFLPLELRLSMWFYNNDLSHLTVLPTNTLGVSDKEHYEGLFEASGAQYFFVHEKDPHLEEKLRRGRDDLQRVIHHPFAELNTTEHVQELMPEMDLEKLIRLRRLTNLRIIPDMATEPTTPRTQRMLGEDIGFDFHERTLEARPNKDCLFHDLDSSEYFDLTFSH